MLFPDKERDRAEEKQPEAINCHDHKQEMVMREKEWQRTIFPGRSADIGHIVKECSKQHIIQRVMQAEIYEEWQAYDHETGNKE